MARYNKSGFQQRNTTDRVLNHLIGLGSGAITGGVSSYLVASKMAKKKGLKPGTAEYKKYIRKKMMISTGSGSLIGLGLGAGYSKRTDKKVIRYNDNLFKKKYR